MRKQGKLTTFPANNHMYIDRENTTFHETNYKTHKSNKNR